MKTIGIVKTGQSHPKQDTRSLGTKNVMNPALENVVFLGVENHEPFP